jgi:hypothetical protein
VARLLAPVTLAVYRVRGARVVVGVRVKVAIWLVASNVTVPVGFVAGAAAVTVKEAPLVSGDIGSLNEALMLVVLIETLVALLAGLTAVT